LTQPAIASCPHSHASGSPIRILTRLPPPAQILRIFDVLRDLVRLRPNIIRLIKALFSVRPD
jgi:hypothetical protein